MNPEDGDVGLHRAVFPLLREAALALRPFAPLRRAEPFRVVLQIVDDGAWEIVPPSTTSGAD